MREKVNFEFHNNLTPSHIDDLFLKIQFGDWYSVSNLVELLRQDSAIDGRDIVSRNVHAWAGIGIGEIKIEKSRSVSFQITPLGRYLQEIYSTNNDLFFDIIHYLFYSTWLRSRDMRRVRCWVYMKTCNELWQNSPSEMKTINLASKIQALALDYFQGYYPSIPIQSIRSVFPWLKKLAPPFLEQAGNKSDLVSLKRSYCTPQLFYLAVDLLYSDRHLTYGTSLNVDDEITKEISMTCLLDPERFWEMAERTQMMIKGFELRKSQWGPTITLNNAPNWIELPTFEIQESEETEEGD